MKNFIVILNRNLISEWILTQCVKVEVASCETIILVCHVAVGSRRLLTSKFSTNWGLSSLLLAKTGISAKAEEHYTHLQKLCVPLHTYEIQFLFIVIAEQNYQYSLPEPFLRLIVFTKRVAF